LDISTIGHLYI